LGLFPPGTCIDLGAGHGTFAIEAANLGWSVTAVDARTQRFPEEEQVTWLQADIREVDLQKYDVILCLGLFYHLTIDDQLDLLRRASGHPLIIDTHLDHGSHTHPLSEPVNIKGFKGRMYREAGHITSSWGNPESFWPDLDSFHRMLDQSEYRALTFEPWLFSDRTFFLALPAPTG
jgi:hypothetical protein